MRLVTFTRPGRLQQELGAMDASGAVLDLAAAEPLLRGQSMLDLAGASPALLAKAHAAAAKALEVPGAKLCAPIPRTPRRLMCGSGIFTNSTWMSETSAFAAT